MAGTVKGCIAKVKKYFFFNRIEIFQLSDWQETCVTTSLKISIFCRVLRPLTKATITSFITYLDKVFMPCFTTYPSLFSSNAWHRFYKSFNLVIKRKTKSCLPVSVFFIWGAIKNNFGNFQLLQSSLKPMCQLKCVIFVKSTIVKLIEASGVCLKLKLNSAFFHIEWSLPVL